MLENRLRHGSGQWCLLQTGKQSSLWLGLKTNAGLFVASQLQCYDYRQSINTMLSLTWLSSSSRAASSTVSSLALNCSRKSLPDPDTISFHAFTRNTYPPSQHHADMYHRRQCANVTGQNSSRGLQASKSKPCTVETVEHPTDCSPMTSSQSIMQHIQYVRMYRPKQNSILRLLVWKKHSKMLS